MFGKKLSLSIVALLLAVCAVFCFAACDSNTDDGVKQITVCVGDRTFEVETEQQYLHGVLCEMKRDGRISAYVFTEGAYGVSFTQVDSLTQDPLWQTPPFLSLWHSVNEFALKSVYNAQWADSNPSRSGVTEEDGTKFVTYTHNQTLLYYSGVGVGALPVKDGATYAIFVD